jgi:transposase, IS5 family
MLASCNESLKMKQSSFSDLSYDNKKKKTRKERFLGEMDAILPWPVLLKPIKRKYPKGDRGRPPVSLERMLRIYFMQQWYALSDPAMEDSLYDIESMRRFAGVDLESIPDESTICKFRHFLETHELTKKLFELTAGYLSERGLMLNEGTIVDASIIAAPSSTKNAKKERDPDMKQTKKGNQWYFGMKAHIGTDTEGRTHSVVATAANMHDSVVMEDLLHGEETHVYGDKAYADAQRQAAAEAAGVTWRVNRKANRGRQLNCADKAFNRKSNRVRAKVEHAFGIIKHLWGYRKVRYKGLEKNAVQLFTLFALANFYMVRRQLAV